MSIHNRYADVPLTEDDFTAFDAQFAVIERILAALQEPDGLILRRVAKIGMKSDTFTRDALILAAQHEELLPRGMDVQELQAQVKLRDELKSRALAMKLMARKMEKIVQLLGSDVFSGALAAYKAMKTNHRGTLDEQLRELGRIFRNRKKEKENQEESETPVTAGETASESAGSTMQPELRAESPSPRSERLAQQPTGDSLDSQGSTLPMQHDESLLVPEKRHLGSPQQVLAEVMLAAGHPQRRKHEVASEIRSECPPATQ